MKCRRGHRKSGMKAEIRNPQVSGSQRGTRGERRNSRHCYKSGLFSDCHFYRFLVASHIKPWVDSEPEEKLDPDNGFLLCPNHDKLFDQGSISFEEDGTVKISNELTDIDKIFMNVNDKMKIELKGQNRKFLEYHREHIFKG